MKDFSEFSKSQLKEGVKVRQSMIIPNNKPLKTLESQVVINKNILKREASKEYFLKDPLSNLLHQNQQAIPGLSW